MEALREPFSLIQNIPWYKEKFLETYSTSWRKMLGSSPRAPKGYFFIWSPFFRVKKKKMSGGKSEMSSGWCLGITNRLQWRIPESLVGSSSLCFLHKPRCSSLLCSSGPGLLLSSHLLFVFLNNLGYTALPHGFLFHHNLYSVINICHANQPTNYSAYVSPKHKWNK